MLACAESSPAPLAPILELSASAIPRWVGEIRTARGPVLLVREENVLWSLATLGDAPAANRRSIFETPEGWSIADLVLLDRGATDDLLIRIDRAHQPVGGEQVWRVDGSTLSPALLVEVEPTGPCERPALSERGASTVIADASQIVGVLFTACGDPPELSYRVDVEDIPSLEELPCRTSECLRVIDRLPPLRSSSSMAFDTGDSLRVYLTRTEPLDHGFHSLLTGVDCPDDGTCRFMRDYGSAEWFTADAAEVVLLPEPTAFTFVERRHGPLLRITAGGVERIEEPPPSRLRQQMARGGSTGPARYLLRATDDVRYEYEITRIGIADSAVASSTFGGWGDTEYTAEMAYASTATRGVTVLTTDLLERRTSRIYHFE